MADLTASDELIEMARRAPRDASAEAVLRLVARIDAERAKSAAARQDADNALAAQEPRHGG